MKATSHRLVMVTLSVGVSAAWVAMSARPTPESPTSPVAHAVAAAPYESPYPAPRVDPNAPPQEPAPTF